jgi:SAM-dependent methyltransferase
MTDGPDRHSLEILNLLYDHDDYMESIKTVADMGAGEGWDSIWWASRQSRDEDEPRDLNIKVFAIDKNTAGRRPFNNVTWMTEDFSDTGLKDNSIDMVWAHDCLQFSPNPLGTLEHWHNIMKKDAMLMVCVPYMQTLRSFRNEYRIDTLIKSGVYFNWSMGNLIMMLASSGFDCRHAHFKFSPDSPWLYAAVYKTDTKPKKCASWYELLDTGLLPITVEDVIQRTGELKDSDITVEWIDHSIYSLALQ